MLEGSLAWGVGSPSRLPNARARGLRWSGKSRQESAAWGKLLSHKGLGASDRNSATRSHGCVGKIKRQDRPLVLLGNLPMREQYVERPGESECLYGTLSYLGRLGQREVGVRLAFEPSAGRSWLAFFCRVSASPLSAVLQAWFSASAEIA